MCVEREGIYLSLLLLSKSEILNQRNDLITNLIISDSSCCSHEWKAEPEKGSEAEGE